MDCPNRHGRMNLRGRKKTVTLGCNIWDYDVDIYVCPVCGLEIEPVEKRDEAGDNAP
jgi:hypothetical protein